MPPRRTLGGGRVLGTGESINPSPPHPAHDPRPAAATGRHPQHPVSSTTNTAPTATNLDSPAPSTLSIESNSQYGDGDDLASRIFVENGHGASSIGRPVEDAGAPLACPICEEEMVTLLQLNRHLDDAHRNLEDDRQLEVKDWFQIQVEKARKFQPLAVLNQKLKGLDVFESNSNHTAAPVAPARSASGSSTLADAQRVLDPEELVTRAHWQPRSLYDVCSDPTCEKRLTVTNGCVNCRKCGRLFCEEHTMYQMKLSRAALHEPVRGVWCRVCETCYKSREGYNDYMGAERDHTEEFKRVRKPVVDRAYFEVSRLEKRLSRLMQLLATLPLDQVQSGGSKRWMSWQNDQRKTLEQSVVGWEDDAEVSKCPFCQQEFTTYTFRRHHCRTCGRVVCGDPRTECSLEVGLNVAVARTDADSRASVSVSEKTSEKLNIDVRLCKDCRSTLFDRHDFEADVRKEPPDLRAYRNLVQFERGIRLLLPQFQKLLAALQDPDNPPPPSHLSHASKVRRRLIDSFAQYDVAARRIRDLPTTSPTQLRLQKAIYHQATSFLHLHMLPLKTLPKILKHATPNGAKPHRGALAAISKSGTGSTTSLSLASETDDGDGDSNTTSSAPSLAALESEEKMLKERLVVLQEQKFFVSQMVKDATRRRKFDEVASLSGNLEELEGEIAAVGERVRVLEGGFEGVYLGMENVRP